MNQYLLNEAAKIAGVRSYRIVYAISQGFLPEPTQRFNRQRVFTDEDIARIRAYFSTKKGGRHAAAK